MTAEEQQRSKARSISNLKDYDKLNYQGEQKPVDISGNSVINTRKLYQQHLEGKKWLPLIYP